MDAKTFYSKNYLEASMNINVSFEDELTIYLMEKYSNFILQNKINLTTEEIKSIPNDQELGGYVRTLLNKRENLK